MATHGSVKAFNSASDDWETYEERLQHYFIANDVNDAAKKRSILLTVCGAATYRLLRSLVNDGAVGNASYDELVLLLKTHYNPKPSEIVQRWHFNTRVRGSGESIANYVAALRALALHCNYGDKLSEMLRDRLVCGVNHNGIRRKLLAELNLTYDKAFAMAQAMEISERDSKKLGDKADVALTPLTDEEQVHFTPTGGSSFPRQPKAVVTCYRCGGPHYANKCEYSNSICRACHKKGHLERVCRSSQHKPPSQHDRDHRKTSKPTHHVEEETLGSPSSDEESYDMFTLSAKSTEPYQLDVILNDVPIKMEMDTGASLSVLNETTYQQIKAQTFAAPLQPTRCKLRTYTGENIQVLGTTEMKVLYGETQLYLPIHVVKCGGPNLMGRDWLSQFEVKLADINVVEPISPLASVLEEFADVFSDELGCLKGEPVQLGVPANAEPKFFKARSVPFLLKEKVEKELDRLQAQGIISPVKFSRWAAPIVPVLKKNGKVRICGDFKITVNKVAPTEIYPLPRVEELFANLSGGKYFSKLDMSSAYLQLPLHADSKQYVTINTHKGLFQYNRLPFGVASAPAIFQRYMETLLQGLKGTSVFIDDILVTGSTIEEHLQNLRRVLEKLQADDLCLNRIKCFFLQPSLEHLGHIIDKDGLHPTPEKTRAIKEAPTPKNTTELRSFLGLLNYYGKFLPNLSTKLHPLHTLLNKNQTWQWGTEQEQTFQLAKEALQADTLLVHYDTTKPLVLACDASQYGIGAVLSHVIEGQERPVAYISRTLSAAEKNYSQIEKEALAIVYAVKKFHMYLYGRHFVIESDHRPLSFLFGETTQVPQMASSRIQRWAITLSAYKYTIRYKAGKDLGNADAFSRLPRPVTTTQDHMPEDLALLLNHLSSTSIGPAHIKEWTSKDPILSCVRRFVLTGWPDHNLGKEYQPYTSRKDELSELDGCVLWASRVIVPPPGRQLVLNELHETHPGVNRMKSLARGYIWWPGMDAEIAEVVKTCPVCQESRPSPAAAPLHPWEWPTQPWSRIHLDYAGPFLGQMFLIIVDSHSKWIDVHIMQSITSSKTIEKLRIVFANHGFPRKVVTDNGPSFTSDEFNTFMSDNGIVHVTTAPYHPSSNGLAERAVQTFKQGLKRTAGKTIQERLSKFLLTYRITPQTSTGVAPSTLLMGRRLRSRLDRFFPDLTLRVEDKQLKQAQQHDCSKPLRSFKQGDRVYVKDFTTSHPKWIPGKIVKTTGPLSYHVELLSGNVVRRHVDAIRTREVAYPRPHPLTVTSAPSVDEDDLYLPDFPPTPATPPPPPPPPPLPTRRSDRHRAPPDRLGWKT